MLEFALQYRRAAVSRPSRQLAALKAALLALIVTTAPATAQQRVLTVGAATFPESLQSGVASFTSQSLVMQTNESLVMRDNAGNFMPWLAEKWEAVDDTTWRFHLRKGVKWHDGKDFTAADVKFTIDRIVDPKSAYGLFGRIGQVTGAEIVDASTVDIKTKTVFPTLAKGLSDIVIEPKHYYEQVGADLPKRKPLGTGPWVAQNWVPGDRYELTANKGYWRGAPKVDRLIIRQIPEAATRISALISGEVHVIEEVPVDVIAEIEASKRAKVLSVPTSVGLVLTYDVRRPPFDNPKVREAMDYAVDKNLILQEILKGRGTVLQGQLLTANTFGHNPAIKNRAYDQKKARQLLQEAGFDFSKPIAIMTQSGKYLSDVDISNAVAGMLREVGVKTDVNVVESAVYLKQWSALEMGPIYMVGWYSLGDGDFATTWFTKGSRRSVWENAEYEKLFIEARSTNDSTTREKAYHRMMEIMNRENPSMFLFGLPSIYAASDKITGFGAAADKILRLSEVSIK